MPEQIAPQVTAFFTAHMRRKEALQVLMLLVESPARWRDAAAIRRQTRLAANLAARRAGRALQQLASLAPPPPGLIIAAIVDPNREARS